MARQPRHYRAPLVITLAATLAPACSQPEVSYNPPFPPYSGTGGTPHPGPSSGGSGGEFIETNPPFPLAECPPDVHSSYEPIECAPDALCVSPMACTSGMERDFLFRCSASGDWWALEGENLCEVGEDCDSPLASQCDHPYESCTASGAAIMCGENGWFHTGVGGNPPEPCPKEAPELGSECNAGVDFGADRLACGYPCGEDEWTIIGCVAADDSDPYDFGPGTWEGDGVCEMGGAGGVGGAGGEGN